MTVNALKDGTKLTITAEGKLGTTSAPELEKAVKDNIGGVTELIFDFAKLEYISSAGLRVLAGAIDAMEEQGGEMFVSGANEDVLDVFDVTGFADELNLI